MVAPCTVKNGEYVSNVYYLYNTLDYNSQVICTTANQCVCKIDYVAVSGTTYSLGCQEGLKHPTQNVCEKLGGTYNKLCKKDGIIICVPAESQLTNYRDDCSCRFGFTGKLCDKERMMCLFSGEESFEGDKCSCLTQDGDVNHRVSERGCCTLGTYFDQSLYSTFSPLSDFQPYDNSVLFSSALLQTCSPSMTATSYENDHDRIITIHNYVSGTDEHILRTVTPCLDIVDRKSLYFAKERYFSSSNSVATLVLSVTDTVERKIELCLQHCIKNTLIVDEESDVEVYRGFTLSGYDTHSIERITVEYKFYSGDAKRVRVFGYANHNNYNTGRTDEERIQYCNWACTGTSRIIDRDNAYHNPNFWNEYSGQDVTHFAVGLDIISSGRHFAGRCYCYVNTAPTKVGEGLTPACEDDDSDLYSSTGEYLTYRIVRAPPKCVCETELAYFSDVVTSTDSKRFDILYPYDADSALNNPDEDTCFIDSIDNVVQHADEYGKIRVRASRRSKVYHSCSEAYRNPHRSSRRF